MQKTSEEDIDKGAGAARRHAALSEEIAAFIESGLSIIVGVVGPEGRALPGRALAARVTRDARIRLIYVEEGNAAISATAEAGGPVAVTFSAPLSHRTVQIKGYSSTPEKLLPADEDSTRQQTDALSATLSAIGEPPLFVKAFADYRSSPLRVLSFQPQEAFEQTPGPGAGRSL